MAKSTAKKPATKPATKPVAKKGLPSAARVTARARTDPVFKARALADPGLRSRITDTTLLRPEQRQARELHTRLTTPIVTGSKITGADLAHQAAAAGQVEFGPKEQDLKAQLLAQQQRSGDIDRWYGQYLAQVQNYAQGVGQAEDVATGQIAGLGAGVTGLGQETAQRIQQGANADAAARGTTAQNIVPLADQGTVARQALVGSYVGQQAQRAAAEKDYAAGLAGPVAGAQRLGALTGQQRNIEAVRKKQSELTGLKSAANLKYRTEKTQQEFANQVALGTLDISRSNALANTPAAKAAQATTTASLGVDATNAKKAGVSLKTWQALAGGDQQKLLADADKRAHPNRGAAAAKPATSGPYAGFSADEVGRHSQGWRDSMVKRYYDLTHKPGSGSGTKPGGGSWTTNEQQGKANTQVSLLKGLATKAKTGIKFDVPAGQKAKADPKGALPRNGANSASAKLQAYAGTKLLNPILVTAALDAVYNDPPGLSAATVKGLIDAGYKPGQIARVLGVSTAGQRAASGVRAPSASRAGTSSAPAAGATTTSSQSR